MKHGNSHRLTIWKEVSREGDDYPKQIKDGDMIFLLELVLTAE